MLCLPNNFMVAFSLGEEMKEKYFVGEALLHTFEQ